MRLVPLNLLKLYSKFQGSTVQLLLIVILIYISCLLSSDLNVKKSGPGITMPPQN